MRSIRFTVGSVVYDNKNFDNILMNYRRYQRVLSDDKLVSSLNEDERNTLQEFVKNHTILIPARVRGKQTSLKLRTCVAALHVFIVGGDGVKDPKQFIMDAVHRICQTWYGEDGKGLSGFVMDTMVRECFDNQEKGHFDVLVATLNSQCASLGSKVHNGYNIQDGTAVE